MGVEPRAPAAGSADTSAASNAGADVAKQKDIEARRAVRAIADERGRLYEDQEVSSLAAALMRFRAIQSQSDPSAP